MTVIWCMIPEMWSATDRIFCHFGPVFCLFTPLTAQKIKIFIKMKKPPGNIIILHKCTINDNYMMSGSWDIWSVTDKIFCHLGPFFALLSPDNWKNQNFEKLIKKAWIYHHFTHVYEKSWLYAILFLRYGA